MVNKFKMNRVLPLKALISSLLLLLFLFLAFSGALLYFGKTGMVMGFARNTLREAHAWAAALTCILAAVHFFINRRIYLAEVKSITRVRERFLKKFTLFNLMTIALMAALGIAVKAVIVPFVHLLTGALYIPGGAVAGGIYMMFLVLAVSLTGIRGAVTLCGFCQGVMVLIVGSAGSHGALSILSYTLTGLSVDLLMLLIHHRGCCLPCCFLGGIAANLVGALIVNMAFFNMPLIPLVLSLAAAALSGGLGGAVAWTVTSRLLKHRVIQPLSQE